jgi:hypothetical protein
MFPAKAADHAVQCLVAVRAAHLELEERGAKEGVEGVVDQRRHRSNLMQRWRITGLAEEQRRMGTL